MEFYIDSEELGIDSEGYGEYTGFVSYYLTTHGHDESTMLFNATIEIVNQDGGEIDSIGIDDSSNRVYDAALNLIKLELKG